MVLPLLHIRIYEPQIVQLPGVTVTPDYNFLYAVTIYGQGFSKELEQTISSTEVIMWGYFIGMLFFSFRFLYRYMQIRNIKNNGKLFFIDGVEVVSTNESMAPFSFLNTIFIPQDLMDEEGYRQIILHEMEHVKQRHSYDILILEILTIIQWCNPFVWLLKRAVHENHEYLADNAVLATGVKRGNYKLLLLNQCMGDTIFIASPFNYSLIKNRIKMMNKIKSPKIANLKYLLGVFFAVGLIVTFAYENKLTATETQFPEMQDEDVSVKVTMVNKQTLKFAGDDKILMEIRKLIGGVAGEKREKLILSINTDNPQSFTVNWSNEKNALKTTGTKVDNDNKDKRIFVRVEQMPAFPGGQKAMLNFLAENIKYPKQAVEQNIEGNVYLKFVVTKTGDVGDVQVLRSPHELLSNEAIRVVKLLPKFKPGMQRGQAVDVWYQMPVRFENVPPATNKEKK
ncbi:M56 family metallopeptidase [Balneicella halophila]|nr:M56 family metallopeptidase [Balneicella halophila]